MPCHGRRAATHASEPPAGSRKPRPRRRRLSGLAWGACSSAFFVDGVFTSAERGRPSGWPFVFVLATADRRTTVDESPEPCRQLVPPIAAVAGGCLPRQERAKS